jgi:hypothetical protein
MKKTIILTMALCASGSSYCTRLMAATEAPPNGVVATVPASRASNRLLKTGDIPDIAGLKSHGGTEAPLSFKGNVGDAP